MDQINYHGLVVMEGQPPPRIGMVTTPSMDHQSTPPVNPKPRRANNRKKQPCVSCQQPNCRNGSLCKRDDASPLSNQVTPPAPTLSRPTNTHRARPTRPTRTNQASSPPKDPSASPTTPPRPKKPRAKRKVSEPPTGTPIPQPIWLPPWTVAPEHLASLNLLPQGLQGHGRSTFTPPVLPNPQQRRAMSHSSANEQDHILLPSPPPPPPPRKKPHCREWLNGNCPDESNCSLTHDPDARAARELRLKKIADQKAAKAAQEAAATIEEFVLPSTKVTFSAGVTVKKILTGYEPCRVLVKNLPLTATKAEVVTLFAQPGIDPEKFTVQPPHPSPGDRSHKETVVEFEDFEVGKNVVAGLDEIEFGSEKLKLVVISRQGGMGKSKDRNSHTLTVTWPAPSDTAFASYNSMDEATSKRTELEKKSFNGRKVKTNFAKKPTKLPDRYWNSATISVTGLEPGVSMEYIQEFCGTTSIRMATRNARSYDLKDAIPSLEALVIKARPEDYGSVTWEHNLVPDKHGLVSAKIHFPTWDYAKVIYDLLDQKPIPLCGEAKCFVSLTDPLHYTIHVPYLQYKAQGELFQSLVPAKNDRAATARLRILANQSERPARVELSGSDKKTVGRLKVRIEQLMAGEKLPQWDRIFYTAEGETFLKKVNNESGAYVRADKRQRMLKAFGGPAAIEQAKAMIQEEVDRLASLQFEVPLKPLSVRFFVDGAQGSTLLKQEVGEENVVLDVSSSPCKIIVRGGEPARHFLNKLIDESLSGPNRSQHQLKDGETCPVCYDTIDHPYRLACGHVYCDGCIRHFLLSASDTKQFPLSCIGDEGKCSVPIPLPIIGSFLLPAQFKRLLEVSFLEYLGHNPDKFRYCTTPDCPEIFSPEDDSGDGIFRCRSCFISICISCREEHDGFTCEEWKADKMLEGWADGNKNVKKCPKCDILIEKNGGCNHMTCPKCGVHICWVCMGEFPDSGQTYHHMELAHGGNGLNGLDELAELLGDL